MEAFAVAIRGVHLLGASLLAGVFAFLALVLRPAERAVDSGAAELAPLDTRLVALGRWALALTLATGVLDLWRQTGVATGLGFGGVSAAAFGTVLARTQYGTVWLVRHGLLLLLGAFLVLTDQERDARDRWTLWLEALGLAGLSLALVGAAGHAASAQRIPGVAILVDAVHLLATGVWFGGLLPLAVLLGWARRLPGPAGSRLAATATHRFARMGLASMGLLVLTGVINAWVQVGSVPALLGTAYGRWLGLKVALLGPLLAIAGVNHLVLTPRLRRAAGAGHGDRAATRRLRRHVVAEVILGGAILGVVGILGLTTPGRHAVVTWPLSYRLAWDVAQGLPGVRTRVAIGSQLAALGLVVGLIAGILRGRRWGWVVGAGAVAVATGLWVALPPLAVDAYPTTYVRPAVPYAAGSVAKGQALYRAHCVACHGVGGYGDGPAAAGLRPRPADLTAPHTGQHTAGDLFWWLTHGMRGSAMPGFGGRLSAEERWDLINFLRALASAEQARSLGPVVEPTAGVVAPDILFTTGVEEDRSLQDSRGRWIVLEVFFTLPDSRSRLVELAHLYPTLRARGAEVLGIPLREARRVYRALGEAPVLFPIVVDGAEDAAAAYGLFRRDFSPEGQEPDPPPPRHMELLVDRQGYVRARWIPGASAGWADAARLLAAVEELAREAPRAPVPEEHVH